MRSKPLDLRSVIGSLSRSNAKHPSPARVQSESNLTEVIRRNRSKNKCRHVRERCPSIPRLVRHEFLMAVMPHDRQPCVAVATTPKEVASSGFVHEKDSTNPGMATALRTCPVTPCRVQHVAHGLRPATTVRPSPRQVQHGAHGLPACGAQVRPESIPKPRDFNIYLNISGLLIFRITWFSWLFTWFP